MLTFSFQLLFVQSFILTTLLTAGLYLLARKIKLLPAIRKRDVHEIRKPRIGGLAMWLAAFLTISTVILAPSLQGMLSFGHSAVAGVDHSLWGILTGLLVILLFGLLDDLKGLSPGMQLLGQLLAALCLVIFGVGADYIRLPFDLTLWLHGPSLHLWGEVIYLGSALFTLLWTVAIINVVNFFDGLDGLAGSVGVTASIILFFISLRLGNTATASLAVILFGITSGFLPWNWYPSHIFMGTVGSQLLGFLLAVIAIISGGKVATGVLVLGIPVFDALFVIARRIRAGVSPFKADQRHLHHRLLKLGLSVPEVVVVINAVAVLFGILALSTQRTNDKGILLLLLIVMLIGLLFLTHWLERRKGVH